MCPKFARQQRGLGLVAALFAITVMALIAVGMTNLSVTAQQSYGVDIQSSRAFMAAQSGAELELNRLMQPADFPQVSAVAASCLSDTPHTPPPYTFSGGGLQGCSANTSCQTISVATASVLVHRVESVGQCGSGADRVTRKVSLLLQTSR
ncbi:pilus assembly PilX family protein [Motiliproteus sediminis]|uniref:pilus assembly PilX family protein n=1 Tax=Motiliproteus sediminis TaxID=1468178 RepID=UPI001AF0017C|nr:hypothetical protein [Motiliproteus sediminis]